MLPPVVRAEPQRIELARRGTKQHPQPYGAAVLKEKQVDQAVGKEGAFKGCIGRFTQDNACHRRNVELPDEYE